MTTRMARFASACALGSWIAIVGCDDGGSKKVDDDGDPALQEDAGEDAEMPPDRVRDGGRNSSSDAGSGDGGSTDAATGSEAGSGADGSAGGGSKDDAGHGDAQRDAATSTPDASNGQAEGGQPPSGDCAAKAKSECEYQKMCDPVHFALEWDGDINQFCVPKRKAACEAGLPLTAPRAIGDACDTWVKASCDNYRNFHHKIVDTNGKWQYGDRACELTPTVPRGTRALDDACTMDTQCKAGLFCKVEADDYRVHNDTNVERICGKCAAQYAYEGAYTSLGFYADESVCYRHEQCKAGYQCLRVYGTENDKFLSLDFSAGANPVDLNHCVKTITKVGKDKDCAKGSNIQCDEGLVCQGATAEAVVGTCKVPTDATIPTYAGKDARCNPAVCDPRLHLECKPVKVGANTEERCVQTPVAAIGAYCKNDKKETVAECSNYARCVESSGLCVRRNVENESCFASTTTPGTNDRGSCDPNVYAEKPLVCRQDAGELSSHCHEALPQNMCSKQ